MGLVLLRCLGRARKNRPPVINGTFPYFDMEKKGWSCISFRFPPAKEVPPRIPVEIKFDIMLKMIPFKPFHPTRQSMMSLFISISPMAFLSMDLCGVATLFHTCLCK